MEQRSYIAEPPIVPGEGEDAVAIVQADAPVLLLRVGLDGQHPRAIGVSGIAIVVEVVLVAVVLPQLPDPPAVRGIGAVCDPG